MQRSEDVWTQAHQQAQAFLRRFGDAWTRGHREDLVQESAIAAWRWSRHARDQERLWAAVRTIARRLRHRGLLVAERRRQAQQEPRGLPGIGDWDNEQLLIVGRRVPAHWVRPHLQRALGRLGPIDRQVLLGFYEGFCCAELAVRFGMSEESIKTRLHRARKRVKREVEASVRVADDLDE